MERSKKLYALVDCNSFYCACERVFRADLIGKPIAILSNNDGCVVALTKEAKELGLERFAPYFKFEKLIKEKNIHIFSSNYSLYADMSARVMEILSDHAPRIEVYSIDEAFLDLTGIDDPLAFGKMIKEKVYRYTGIPVSVGIAPTKTLAKLANNIGKKDPLSSGVVYFPLGKNIDTYLDKVAISSIWGIGRANEFKLQNRGIYTALQLKETSEGWIRKNMGGVVGLRTVQELKGIECITLETITPDKKGIVSSRSFGEPVTTLKDMKEAISSYVARAALKLRRQESKCSSLTVFIKTNRFKDEPQYNNSITYIVPEATNDTIDLTEYALKLLKKIYRDGFKYKSAGIMLDGIIDEEAVQPSLFSSRVDKVSVMEALDRINRVYGNETIKTASCGLGGKWYMRREMLSSCFTTNIHEVLKVRI